MALSPSSTPRLMDAQRRTLRLCLLASSRLDHTPSLDQFLGPDYPVSFPDLFLASQPASNFNDITRASVTSSDDQLWRAFPLFNNSVDLSPDSTPPGLSSYAPALFPPSPTYPIPAAILKNNTPFWPALGLNQSTLGLELGEPDSSTFDSVGIAPSLLSHAPSQPIPAQSQRLENISHAHLIAGSPVRSPSPSASSFPAPATRNPRKRIIDESEYLANVSMPRAKKGPDGKRACTVAGCTERVTAEQLKRHLKSHLPPAVKNERHRCQCGRSYSRQDALHRHRGSHGHL